MKTHRPLRLLTAGLLTLTLGSAVIAQTSALLTGDLKLNVNPGALENVSLGDLGLPKIDTNLPVKPAPKKFLGSVAPDFSRVARASRPTLVVLIHGGTSDPAKDPSPFEPDSASHRPGMIGYSRFYWDFPFVSALLNVTGSNPVFTMGGTPLRAATWQTEAIGNIGPNDIENQFAFRRNPALDRGRFNGTAVCLLKYNGSIGLGQMARQAVAQLMDLRAKFEAYAGREPYFVLAGHSKGGLVIRYLLSIPDGNVAGVNLTANERAFLNELRNDTRFAMTISSPHTGSPLADYGNELRQNLIATQNVVDVAWNVTRAASSAIGVALPPSPPLDLRLAADLISGNDGDLGHLTSQFWNTMNNGPLHPSRMKRSNDVPVPVYLYGGRRPSHLTDGLALFGTAPTRRSTFAAQTVDASRRLLGTESQQISARAAIGLTGLDWALHNVLNDNWGLIRSAGPGKPLDLVRRSWYDIVLNRMTQPGQRMISPRVEGIPTYYLTGQQDRETDNDGMVGIDSALAIGLFTGPGPIENLQALGVLAPPAIMEPFDRSQNIAAVGQATQSGPFYRMYSGNWNFESHFTQTKRRPLGTELRRLVIAAGPQPTRRGLSAWPLR